MVPKSVGEFVTYSTDSSGSCGVVHVLGRPIALRTPRLIVVKIIH